VDTPDGAEFTATWRGACPIETDSRRLRAKIKTATFAALDENIPLVILYGREIN